MTTFTVMNLRKLHSIFFLAVSITSYAQSIDIIIDEAEQLFAKTKESLVFPSVPTDKDDIQFYYPTALNKNVNLLESELKEWQSKQYKKDIGLVFKTTARYNFRDAIEEETQNYLKGSVRGELEWNILKMGYVYNRLRAKRLQNDIEVLNIESERSQKILWRRQFRIDYNFILNKEVLQLLESFLVFENEYFDVLNSMYFQKLIKRERLIEVSNQIAVIKSQQKILSKENEMITDSVSVHFMNVTKLPLVKIVLDSAAIFQDVEKIDFKEENVRLQHHPMNDLNLSLYATQNYNYSTNTHKFFPSVGIRFRAPIRFNHRKKIIETKIKILKAQEVDKSVGKYNNSITYVSEYNEKLKDLQNQYKSWHILEERIRILKVLKEELNNAETGLLLLELVEEQFKVLENTLQLKRQLYQVIAHLFELNKSIEIQNFVQPFQFEIERNQEVFCLQKSEQYSLAFQLAFLRAKKIKNITVLSSDKSIQEQLKKKNISFVLVDSVKGIRLDTYIRQEVQRIKI
ncbi:hypothetical protein RQM59_02180 [Flavobacteriaceae bacterium S356]|uniref:TolC family protein n=1 Tax=Asprobacillus argus TaxID=3076534 RepID=A0ABU3LCA3_9FLAO|nr:hypothetical protein [Flavobacteriaceae bacterium S356]